MLTPEQAIDRLRAAFGGPPGYRTLHAKGRFYTGTFTATPEATALCRAGHLDGAAARGHRPLVERRRQRRAPGREAGHPRAWR